MQYWLIKSEPFKYSWDTFEQEQRTFWDGVRNYQARNYLRQMKLDDLALWYHSNEGKEIVGIAQVIKEHYPDPTATEGDWSVVEFAPFKKLKNPVSLATLKSHPVLSQMNIFRQMRLSVVAVTQEEFETILALSNQ
jgi:predicted RNA-binding protein with PUA-like domain